MIKFDFTRTEVLLISNRQADNNELAFEIQLNINTRELPLALVQNGRHIFILYVNAICERFM